MIYLKDYLIEQMHISDEVSVKKATDTGPFISNSETYLFEIQNCGHIYMQLPDCLNIEWKEVILEIGNIIIGRIASLIEQEQHIETQITHPQIIKSFLTEYQSSHELITYQIYYQNGFEYFNIAIPSINIFQSHQETNQLADLNS